MAYRGIIPERISLKYHFLVVIPASISVAIIFLYVLWFALGQPAGDGLPGTPAQRNWCEENMRGV